jgi:hypothetical protein
MGATLVHFVAIVVVVIVLLVLWRIPSPFAQAVFPAAHFEL